jgi:succinate dehydrogenase / fumarate reductase, iron-sulfur subunit
MNLTLKIWRQEHSRAKGRFETYQVQGISPDCSFLEMLDILNQQLIDKFEKPVCFDHDCREGICGACSLYINGRPHGPDTAITTCQLHMRKFRDGDTIVVEPWRAKPFPVIKDLVVDRSALDRIIEAGGYISVSTGGVPDANSIPVRRDNAEISMDAAACIGCGACVAACKNASAMLFVAAKVSQFALRDSGTAPTPVPVKQNVRNRFPFHILPGLTGNSSRQKLPDNTPPKKATLRSMRNITAD